MSLPAASTRARSAILSRLRAAAPVELPAPDVAAYYADAGTSSPAAMRERFIAQARGWRAEVIETDAATWPNTLAAVLADKGVRRLMAGRDTALVDGLHAATQAPTLDWYDAPIETLKPVLFDTVDAGITTTLGGIADTGSLILWPDTREPRTLSLLPPLHIAVLREEDLQPTLYAAMRHRQWASALPTNALLVTGPSKTADIQRLLVYGAHGPRELVILLLRTEATA
ncbi:LutC/YkgG family protein [Pseudoxanthomonas japonensis]|uniref:Lactate utilization protein C n=1 Tax=Pseudoxanthomonas japonensis TaxID=69284 RepID=A0ABQ6ZIZ6_9GAMM|nr:lactate utilization protein C [Pseudoxanthomonas japonensis]KAF1726033.1 lactate utilization protein C [Pseudoxanthomonas japonensis]